MSRLFLIVLVQLCSVCVWCQVTRVCQLQNGNEGACTSIFDCPTVMRDYYDRGVMPTICPLSNNVYSVCCPVLKRVEKCKEYGEYVYETVTIPAFRPGSRPIVQRKDRCGRNGAPFISGGVVAVSREYPHSALLGYQPNDEILWRCGGSLVSTRYVLTAGHCLQNSALGLVIKVRLGDLNYTTTSDDARPVDYDVETRIPHPDYKQTRQYNDIGLIKLASQVALSPYVRPVCLPTDDIEPNEYIATGWGFTADYGTTSDTLLKVKLQSFDFDECLKSYSYHISRKFPDGLKRSQLCAGHRTERKDTCTGDSGGPLQVYHPTVPCSCIQYGITSFGISCEQINFPAVYTRVFHYVDWIEGIIWGPGEDK